MPDRTTRLLNSLRWLERHPDGWLRRETSDVSQRATFKEQSLAEEQPPADEQPLADWGDEVRRAFPLADAMSIGALTAICSPMSVPGGVALIRESEQPDALYIVVTGLFTTHLSTEHDDGIAADGFKAGAVVGERFEAGAVIGDIGFITGEPWASGIRALRNSELLRIAKQDLERATAHYPGLLRALSAGAIRRLQSPQPTPATPYRPRALCLVPADPTIDIRSTAQKIAGYLSGFGTVTVISAEQASGRSSAWLSRVERGSDLVLFEAEAGATAWSRFCLRQCDRIVLVAEGDTAPEVCGAIADEFIDLPHTPSLSLMLLWHQAIVPERTTQWLKSMNPEGHYHVRSSRDLERASRLIMGRGLGLVLSGGGARALAHIGVIETLRQHDIQIDAVGGTSIGAIIAAVFALEWDLTATIRSLAAAFNRRRFSDFTVPRTALYSERAFARTLGHCFGNIALEDSPIPLFCVSTNLTKGISSVHRTGRLVTWLRATSAVPGICPPIMDQNAVYVDGGILNNMPTEFIRDFGVTSAIAVDVGSSLEGQARSDGGIGLPNIWDLLWRVGTIGSDTPAGRIPREGDVVLKPEVGEIGLFEWNAHEKAVAAGQRAALEHLDAIKAAVGRTLQL